MLAKTSSKLPGLYRTQHPIFPLIYVLIAVEKCIQHCYLTMTDSSFSINLAFRYHVTMLFPSVICFRSSTFVNYFFPLFSLSLPYLLSYSLVYEMHSVVTEVECEYTF